MAIHNKLGKEGEDAATAFLQQKGYSILERNWRCGHKELDIIAREKDELIIVEVKTRRNDMFGDPYCAVNNKKIRHIISSADYYIKSHAIDLNVRFDIISIIGESFPFKIEHIIDAFHVPIS